jgi:hypothetical protein
MSFTIIASPFALSEVEGPARAQRGDFVSAQSTASTSLSPNGVGVSEARA